MSQSPILLHFAERVSIILQLKFHHAHGKPTKPTQVLALNVDLRLAIANLRVSRCALWYNTCGNRVASAFFRPTFMNLTRRCSEAVIRNV